MNAGATEYIARACRSVGAKMIYLSTDYVFGGEGEQPWQPDDKSFAPLNFYGETKLMGEKAVAGILDKYFIVRISWVFGKNGNNFVKTMLKVGKNHDTVRVVTDQIGTPTYTPDLARLLCDMAASEKYGFTAKVIKCSMITEDTYKCPMNYNSGEDAKVTLKHNNEDFYVVISGTEETSEGSNLSDMIYPYNFCCIEVFGRDLYGKLRQNIKLPPLFRRRHK